MGSAGTVWAGGETGYLQPFIIKSVDKGCTWDVFYPALGGDNAYNSIAICNQYPDTIYAGMEGMVIKTYNGGQNWIITALQNAPYYFYGIVVNPLNPNHVIAGGSTLLNNFGLFETFDSGNSWTEIQTTVSLSGVSCIVADTVNGELIVYMGTFGDGIYRYRTQLVGIDTEINEKMPYRLELHQNYPNPFNPSTTIKYTIPKKEKVKIEVLNLLGQKIETLVNNQISAGSHEIEFNAMDLPSGVYLYRIEAGGYQEVKKMVLLQ